jgi:hypothetical protein
MKLILNFGCRKVKVKVFLVHASRSRSIAPLIGGERLTSQFGRITPKKEPWCPLNTRLGWPQSRYGPFEEEKNLFLQPGIEPRTERLQISGVRILHCNRTTSYPY